MAVGRVCIKCGGPGEFTSLETTKAWFCSECYADGIRSKFRAALSKTKLFKSKDAIKVLVVGQEGARIDSLLKLIQDSQTQKRPLTLAPTVFLVSSDWVNSFIYKKEEKDGVIFHYVHLSMAFDELETMEDFIDSNRARLDDIIDLFPKNAALRDEFERLLFDYLCCRLAAVTKTDLILTSENAETLAQKTLSTMCFGRAASLSHISNVLDSRHSTIKIVRPLRNITNVEVNFISKKEASSKYGTSVSASFLENVTKEGYPGTVSTVLSVASKVRAAVEKDLEDGTISTPATRPPCWLCMVPSAVESENCQTCLNFFSQLPFRNRQSLLTLFNRAEVPLE